MALQPEHEHVHVLPNQIRVAVLTVSDTRTPKTDISGQLIQKTLSENGYQIIDYKLCADDTARIASIVREWGEMAPVDVIILTGGTGISRRDVTLEAITPLFKKILPGFGEIFRELSFKEIGTRALLSRSVAGIFLNKAVFALPGSLNAVKLAMEKIILPELPHIVSEIQK